MKRLLGIATAALLVLVLAGYSSAYTIANGDLIRIVVETTRDGSGNIAAGTYEYASDLGSLSTILNTTGVVGDSFSAAGIGSDYSNLRVAYYVQNSGGYAYLGTSGSGPLAVQGGVSYASMYSGLATLKGLYNTAGNQISGTQSSKITESTTGSYWGAMDGGKAYLGSYGQFLYIGTGDSDLSALASGGSVDFNLYAFNSSSTPGSNGTILNTSQTGAFTIRTALVGGVGYSEIVPASTVPLPSAALLLAPGLLGLFGLRKRGSV